MPGCLIISVCISIFDLYYLLNFFVAFRMAQRVLKCHHLSLILKKETPTKYRKRGEIYSGLELSVN